MHVIFGSGPLGLAVARELIQRGQPVRLVNRSGELKDSLPGVQAAAGDAYDADKVHELTRDAAVVYQCAQPAYTEWPQKFPPLQAAIIEGVARSGSKLVIGENLYMYGDTNGQPIHEGLPYKADGPKGKTRAAMAEAALAAHQTGKLRVAIGRGSDFFGPGVIDSFAGEIVFGAARQGKAANVLGKIDLPHTLTYIDDFGKALVILGERDEALGQAWHVPNPETVSTRQFVEMVFAAFGKPPKLMVANELMMRILGLFVPEVREMIELKYEVFKPYVVDDSKFVRSFGSHATPLREAVKATAKWYAEET
jgi:nucleoside-diphosphate-sugar epimerase